MASIHMTENQKTSHESQLWCIMNACLLYLPVSSKTWVVQIFYDVKIPFYTWFQLLTLTVFYTISIYVQSYVVTFLY